MSRTLLRRAAFLVIAVAFSGCRDQAPELLAPGAISRNHLPSDASIKSLIAEIFVSPGGHAVSITNHWEQTVGYLETGNAAGAREKLRHTVEQIEKHTNKITPPANETEREVAIRLINMMVSYAFANTVMGSDAVVTVVTPGSRTVVSTPDGHAAIDLPAGAFLQPTVLVISRDPVQSRADCAGPLPTTLCQYPLFYHFDAYPHTVLEMPARIGVCHVNSGPGAPAEEIHDRLRLAHEQPADPAGHVEGGTLHEGIEILPYENVSDFLVCGTTTLASAISAAPTGNSLADRGLRILNRLASAAISYTSPTIAHAIDRGGGGTVLAFSNFNVVDPGEDENLPPADGTPPVVTFEVDGTQGSHGWYTSDVTVTWDATDAESNIVSPPCGSSSVTTDTPGQTFSCTATSAGGTTTESVTIKRDATNPEVAYSGNAATYTVDQTVAITCTASDALSGVADDTCADINGDAYTFGVGNHSYSATATDSAGNSNAASTAFEVRVTPASLCALTRRFSSSEAIGSSLCVKLSAYAASIARDNSVAAAGQLRAYINEVRAQSGKALSVEEAETLTELAMQL